MNIEKPFNFPLQSQLVIELVSGHMIEGTLDHYNQYFIKLRKCQDHYTGACLQSKRLYRSQITNILSVVDVETSATAVCTTSNETTNTNNSTCSTTEDTDAEPSSSTKANPCKQILLPKEEYLRLKNNTKSFVYMGIIDSRYYSAIDVLRNCETIGMSGFIHGIQSLSVLTLSSWDKIYIFDIFELNQVGIPNELQEVLEMPSIEKVIHHGRQLVTCLRKFYKVSVTNLFDTQIADFKIRMQQQPDVAEFSIRNMNEMLSNYLNFPDNIIHKYDAIDWKHRPIDPEYRRYAAETVAYIITLKNTLIRILLKDYYKSINKYVCMTDDASILKLATTFSQNIIHREEL